MKLTQSALEKAFTLGEKTWEEINKQIQRSTYENWIILKACCQFECTQAELLSKSPQRHLRLTRRFIIDKLSKEGWTDEMLGKLLQRHKHTIYYLRTTPCPYLLSR